MTDTPEIWKPVEGHDGYEVSNLGRVAGLKNGERFIRKPNTATHYLTVSFKKRPFDTAQKGPTIHSLVAQAFHGPRPEGAVIRHIDGNRFNNRADNLAYGTKNENVYDTIVHGTYKGTNNGRALLDERHVVLIRLLFESGTTLTAIAKAIGVSISTIHAIKTGRNWVHVS
jgi:hypothetical protein